MKISRSANQLNSVISHQAVFFFLFFFLQVVCELPLIQAVFQRLQAHRGAGGDAAKCAAQKARPPSHDRHQQNGGEPRQLRHHGVGAQVGGQGPCSEAQRGPQVLQGEMAATQTHTLVLQFMQAKRNYTRFVLLDNRFPHCHAFIL